ncbi:MFS transporter [Dactylosporangium maewongense]|uniref:MFS transporter n=1 Tax=Dactylosporangium maewongense TaxID=634393 RepID=A0ABN2CHE8_9ACTN
MAVAEAPPGETGHRGPDWAVLSLLCLGQVMVVLDVSIVNVALPAIRADLGFSDSGLQWVVNAYTLTFAGFLLLGGRAADLFGRRRMFITGLVLFTVASLVGGLAQDELTLIIARGAQGLGGAILSPATLTLLTTTFVEAPKRARAMAAWSAVSGGGAAIGSLLGGVLTDLINWRWILFVNVPIGLAAIVASLRVLPLGRPDPAAGPRRLDLLGSLLVTAGLVAVVYGTVNSQAHGWGDPVTFGPLAVGVVLLAWFVLHEAKVAEAPVVPLRLFASRGITVANLVMFWLGCAVIAHFFFLSLYMQNVLGYDALAAGLAFLPGAIAMTAGAYAGPVLLKRVGVRPLLIGGPLLSGIGLAWLSVIPVRGSYAADLLVPMILVTLGAGIAMTPLAITATSGIPRHEAGLASGVINTTRQVGGSLGLAVLATIGATRAQHLLAAGTAQADAVVSGYRLAFLVGAAFAVVGALTSIAAPGPAPAPAAAPEPAAEPASGPAAAEPAAAKSAS